MAYDPATGQLVLFGGEGNSGVLADTWTWDGSTWTELSPATSPSARDLASMAYDPGTGQLVLFGGEDSNGALADTWTWGLPPPASYGWAQLSPTTSPPARYGAAMTYDPATGQLLLVGGVGNSGGLLSDTWTWSGSKWTELSPASSPPARFLA